ncbi:MAG: hypothetical protein GY757_41175 [bacterium]|nr:hypothetical protein [bacterium]
MIKIVRNICLIGLLTAAFSSNILATDTADCIDKRFVWIGSGSAGDDSFYLDLKSVAAVIMDRTGWFNKLYGNQKIKDADGKYLKGKWIVMNNGTKMYSASINDMNIDAKMVEYHNYLKSNPDCASLP